MKKHLLLLSFLTLFIGTNAMAASQYFFVINTFKAETLTIEFEVCPPGWNPPCKYYTKVIQPEQVFHGTYDEDDVALITVQKAKTPSRQATFGALGCSVIVEQGSRAGLSVQPFLEDSIMCRSVGKR